MKYLNLVGTDEIREQMNSLGIPVSFFLDSEGNILTEPVEGAYLELYPERMEEALAIVGGFFAADSCELWRLCETKKSSRRGWIFYSLILVPSRKTEGAGSENYSQMATEPVSLPETQ